MIICLMLIGDWSSATHYHLQLMERDIRSARKEERLVPVDNLHTDRRKKDIVSIFFRALLVLNLRNIKIVIYDRNVILQLSVKPRIQRMHAHYIE